MSKKVDLDYILEDVVGGGGRWQWRKWLFLVPTYVAMGAPALLMQMFSAYTPPHRCFIEGCDDEAAEMNFTQPFLKFSVPKDHGGSNFLSDVEGYNPCLTYARRQEDGGPGTCSADAFDSSRSVNCSRFVYDHSEFGDTLTTELDLVCGAVAKRHFLDTVMMLGLLAGSLIAGPLGDKIGRKRAMLTGITIALPSMFLGGFVGHYFPYILLRFITCTAIVFCWVAAHNLVMEWFSKSHRKLAYVVSQVVGHGTGLVFPVIVYFNRDYTWMHVWSAVVGSVAIPAWFFVPESPRWLACNKRVKEAEDIIMDMARKNRRPVSEEQCVEIRAALKNLHSESCSSGENEGRLSIADMFRRGYRARTLILMLCWISSIVAQYALLLNVGELAGDMFLNFGFTMLMELPAFVFIYTMADRLGRRKSMSFLLLVLGLDCFLMAFVPKEQSRLVLVLFSVGRFASAATSSLCWLYTAELYPTNLRSQAVGTCSLVSRVFGLAASFVAELASIWGPLPMLVLAVPSAVAGVLSLRLPETAGLALPETYEEAIDLDTKTYSLLKTEDDSESEFAPVDYNEAEMNAQFENLDFENYEMRYSAYDE